MASAMYDYYHLLSAVRRLIVEEHAMVDFGYRLKTLYKGEIDFESLVFFLLLLFTVLGLLFFLLLDPVYQVPGTIPYCNLL